VLDDEADEVFSQTLEIAIRGSRRDEVHSQLGVDRGGTGRVQGRLLFNERGEQVEESPRFRVILGLLHMSANLGRSF